MSPAGHSKTKHPPLMPLILESKTIVNQPGRYLGWATIAKAPDGTLYSTFSGDRDSHVCPFGKVLLISSQDDGVTWSEPTIVANTPLDDRDAGVCVCPDGTLVVSWFTSHFEDYHRQFNNFYLKKDYGPETRWSAWEKVLSLATKEAISKWAPSYESPSEGDYLKKWMGFWTVRSKDGGKTWDEPTVAPVYAPHGPTVLANGDLFYVGMIHMAREYGEETIGAARSKDQGKTWELVGKIHGFPEYLGAIKDGFSRLAEPHVVETASGKLIGMARFEETKDPENPYRSHLWQFDSEDGGVTWSEPKKTQIVGKPPHLTRLANGGILVSYGYRHAPYGQRATLSMDEGKTWQYDHENILRDDSGGGDLGYTSSVELGDGTLLSVYYQIEPGNTRPSLMLTRWKMEPQH